MTFHIITDIWAQHAFNWSAWHRQNHVEQKNPHDFTAIGFGRVAGDCADLDQLPHGYFHEV